MRWPSSVAYKSTAGCTPTLLWLGVRIGLSVGEPVREEQDLFGKSVTLAARISAQAQGGQVLTSQIVYALVSSTEEFAFREVGTFELKGMSVLQTLYEVLWTQT